MRSVTIPFFISHQGCPHTCVFCDQRVISGDQGILPTAEQISSKIELWRTTAGERPLEVAFFGGTFTALSKKKQEGLLAPLQPLLKAGKISSVRLSTRPDYISADMAQWLSDMGVSTIELGVQSLNDSVLAAAGRGHFASDSLEAIRTVKDAGIEVGVQLMPGLPTDTPEFALDSMERCIVAGADFLRIYPVVVLKGTELARLYKTGEYIPLSLERGVALCKLLLQRAMQAGIPVIRIGLQADTGLNAESILAGCWHPALGQMVRSQLYSDLMDHFVVPGKRVTVQCNPSRISDLAGIRRSNLEHQIRRGVFMTIASDATLKKEQLKVSTDGKSFTYSIVKDLNYSIHEV